MSQSPLIDKVEVSAYTIPTEVREGDGTLAWDHTTLVLVEPRASDGTVGLGFSYGTAAMVPLLREVLVPAVEGRELAAIGASWLAMVEGIRNLGRSGICSMAIAALDVALWDTWARVCNLPLHHLLGGGRKAVPIYGSGGFTAYSDGRLAEQLQGWVDQGIPRVKMKIGVDRGSRPQEDLRRVTLARRVVGEHTQLMVDANGAYDLRTALWVGRRLQAESGVVWFEEPVTSDDLGGLARLREELDLDVTAGEYGYRLEYFEQMLGAAAVDVIQADVGRCAGITEWLRVAALAEARHIPLSAHCGPALHLAPATVPPGLRHVEYFHDHARIDRLLFEGTPDPVGGQLLPSQEPGLGLILKRPDCERYRVA